MVQTSIPSSRRGPPTARIRRWAVGVGVLLSLWLLALGHRPGNPIPSGALPAPSPTPTALRRLHPAPSPHPPGPAPRRALVLEVFRLHPDGPLYEGDRLSFEVRVRNAGAAPLAGARVEIRRVGPNGAVIWATALLSDLAPGEARPATWTWSEEAPAAGPLTLVAVAEPADGDLAAGDRITRTVLVRPAAMRPAAERQARWARAEGRCCTHYYLTGTATEAGLARRMAWADAAEAAVRARLGLPASLPTTIVWIPRLLGHGGFTVGDAVILSDPLSDRLPADPPTVLRHELTHRLTCAWLGRADCLAHLPPFLTEGLAVFVAGGHYRPEPLTERAAALLRMGGWIPLERLVEDFYAHPHEIGYLEAGAFVEELVRQGGWSRFRAFMQAIERRPGEPDRAVLDRALQAFYHQDIRSMEARWRERLQAMPADPALMADLRFIVTFYEALRAYQRAYDPSAYFQSPWLPDWRQAIREGIVADFMREPEEPEGRAFWERLQEARRRAAEGDLRGAQAIAEALCGMLGCPADALLPKAGTEGERIPARLR